MMMDYELEVDILEHYLGPRQIRPRHSPDVFGFGIPRTGWWCKFWVNFKDKYIGWDRSIGEDYTKNTTFVKSFDEILILVRDKDWRKTHGLPELKE